jgi:tetratricopeptide (TPR) repeat protein
MLCLTVYESKGLEFNDVILYNFFDCSETSSSQWTLFSEICYNSVKVPLLEKLVEEMDLEDDPGKLEEFQRRIKQLEKEGAGEEGAYDERITLDIKAEGRFAKLRQQGMIYRKFSSLCVELKFLYVAITRAKKRVLIYDDFSDRRQAIQSFWARMGVVQVVTKQMLQEPELMPSGVREFYERGIADEKSTPEQWKLQGIKMFRKRCYDQAIKCFLQSGDADLVLRCQAHQQAESAETLRNEANSLVWKARNFGYLSKAQKRKHIKDSKQVRKDAMAQFKQAGALFEQCKSYTYAGSCFYTAGAEEKAAEMFQKLGQFAQAGECYYRLGMYSKAAKMFEDGKMMPRAIECYERTESWDQLLHSLDRCKD